MLSNVDDGWNRSLPPEQYGGPLRFVKRTRDIDPDALKVLYRLHEHNYAAYLVGGSVRDLLLGRRPKDFDIGTSAHPHQAEFALAHARLTAAAPA